MKYCFALILLLLSLPSAQGQTALGKSPADIVTPAFWAQRSNAPTTIQGLNANHGSNKFDISLIPTNLISGGIVLLVTNGLTLSVSGVTNTIGLYSAPSIATFINNRNNVEIGSTASSTILDWTLSGNAPTNQSINQGIGSVAVGNYTKTDSSSYSTNRTYVLTITDGVTTNTASTSVSFLNKEYVGVSATVPASISDGQIIAMTGSFATSRAISFSASPSAQYIYVAYPASFGAATFTVNGLPNTDWTLTTRNFVNASGATVSYRIYNSNNLLTGTYAVVVQ